MVGKRSMDEPGMMEGSLAFLQFHRDRMLELASLLAVQNCADGIHVTGESRDRQIWPAMAPSNVLQAPILTGRIVQANPAGEMSQRLSSRPIRVVLMPGHDAAMMSRLAKKLVVPEPNRSTQKLRCRDRERRMPQEIVKTRRYAPCAQGMEQHMIRIAGLVRVVFVKQVSIFASCVEQSRQFVLEHFYLFIRQDADSFQVSILMKKLYLLCAERILCGGALFRRQETRMNGMMMN